MDESAKNKVNPTDKAEGDASMDPSQAYGVHSGKSVADIFHAGADAEEPPDEFEAQGHETLQHHKARKQPGATDAEILREEGADPPHNTVAGNVKLRGPADLE